MPPASGAKRPRNLTERVSPAERPTFRLTPRDADVLLGVYQYRMLSTTQIAVLYFPPSPMHRLMKRGIDRATAEDLAKRFPDSYLLEKLSLSTWLLALKRENPALFATLDPALTGIDEARQATWLFAAIEHNLSPPEAFFASPAGVGASGRSPKPSSRCLRRLHLLFQAGFLARLEQPHLIGEGKPLVYVLDRAGARLVAHRLGLAEQDLDWTPPRKPLSGLFLDHLLATNDVMIAMTQACQSHGWRIAAWEDEQRLKQAQMKDAVTITNEAGKPQRVALVPDGYVVVQAGDYLYDFFLEIDRGTVTVETSRWGRRDVARKTKAYQAYLTPPRPGEPSLYEQRYRQPPTALRILTITTTDRRLATLKAVTEAATQNALDTRPQFWFTTQARATSQDLLTAAIWQQAGREGWQAAIW